MNIIWLLILVILIAALLPTWPYSAGLGIGWYGSGSLGVVFIILLILILMGRI